VILGCDKSVGKIGLNMRLLSIGLEKRIVVLHFLAETAKENISKSSAVCLLLNEIVLYNEQLF
jgi:hypothetical protein